MTVTERSHILHTELERITEILKREYGPEKIILFGSLADGSINPASDIDLVIIKKTNERFIDRLHMVRKLTRPIVGVDFIVYTPQEMETLIKEKRGFFVTEIQGKGKIIYEA